MRLKFTLNNTIEGEYITTYSPKGWQDTEVVLKRHEEYDGIFLDYTVKLDFFCSAGKEYIDRIEDSQGIEADLKVKIEIDCDDSGNYSMLYNGKGIMKSYEKTQAGPEYTRLNLEQDGIIQTVLNRLETKIDLTKTETLDGTALSTLTYGPYTLNMHSKTILQTGKYINDQVRSSFTHDQNVHVIPLDIQFNEINEMLYPADYEVPLTTPIFFNDNDFARDINFPYGRIKLSVLQTATITPTVGPPVLYQYSGGFEINFVVLDGSLNVVSNVTVHTQAVVTSGVPVYFDFDIPATTINLPAGYYIGLLYADTYAPAQGTINDYAGDYVYDNVTYLNIDEVSDFPESTAESFAVFETGADIARKITDQADSFRSNFFGRKNSQPYAYDENGCGSFTAFTNGFQVRGFPIADKPVYMSMKEYFDGLNAMHCLGLGVKQDGDNTYIEIEPKEYFYRDEVVLTLNNIRGLNTKKDTRYYYNRFTVGYKEWRKKGLNGLDEFCTIHNYSTLLKSVNTELVAVSGFIAGPYALERQRRERYETTTTTDEDYDNNNFIIALNRSVDGSGNPDMLDVAEKDENFINVTNVYSPETLYNIRFSPARIARNWFKILATSVIKLNNTLKDVKFSFAEGNKNMTSDGTDSCDPANQELIGEGDDLVLTVPASNNNLEPLFTGDIDTLEDYPLSFASYEMLKTVDEDGIPNYYKKVRYSLGTSDYLYGFIDELRYKPVIGKASFVFRRAYNGAEGCTHIYVESGYVECGYVE